MQCFYSRQSWGQSLPWRGWKCSHQDVGNLYSPSETNRALDDGGPGLSCVWGWKSLCSTARSKECRLFWKQQDIAPDSRITTDASVWQFPGCQRIYKRAQYKWDFTLVLYAMSWKHLKQCVVQCSRGLARVVWFDDREVSLQASNHIQHSLDDVMREP